MLTQCHKTKDNSGCHFQLKVMTQVIHYLLQGKGKASHFINSLI